MKPGERLDLPGQRPKIGDFVSIPVDGAPYGRALGRVEQIARCEVYVRLVDGWSGYASISTTRPAPLDEVWRAIEVEQSRVDRRLADLHEIRSKAFERALKAGR